MSSITKVNNNKTTLTSGSTKNLWCRDAMWQYYIDVLGRNPFSQSNGCRLRQCQYDASTCRGAHCATDIKPLPHINTYNRLDKSKYDWPQLYDGIVSSLQTDGPKVILADHARKIADVATLNFVEAIHLWREMACHYRKLGKELPSRRSGNATQHSSGYSYSEDVPKFYLDEKLEDTAWAFERLSRYCPTHKNIENNLIKQHLITVWDLCLATGLNCKEGVHYDDEHICVSDFLTGSCSCITKESIESKEVELQLKKIELTTQLTKMIEEEVANEEDDCWSSRKKGKAKTVDPKQNLRNQIAAINNKIAELSNNQRMIHYTELGMIPFEQQLVKYRAAEEAKKIAIQAAELAKPKESWDHGIETVAAVPTKAIKVTKLGGKKK
jgi:hypothetical protein